MISFSKNFNIIHFLLSLIIPSLILGPFFPDLILSLSSLIFLYYVFKNKNFFFLKKPLIFFFLFCFYCVLLSFFRAENLLLSLESSLFYFRIGVFACLIWYLIEKDKNILIYFYYSLLISFLALVIDGYFQFFYGYNLIGYVVVDKSRLSSFFGDELIMGSYLSRLFPLLFALFLIKKKSEYEIYFIGAIFILVDLLIYISGERSSFFYLNLSSIFIIILIKKYKKFRIITFSIALVLVVILTLSSDRLTNRMVKYPVESMGLLKKSESKNIFTPSHDSMIKTAYNMFLDKPIFGHGPKMFRVICKKKKYQTGISPCDIHPHNFYVQLLAETGIVGFLFLFSLFFYVLICGLIQLKTIILKQKRFISDYQVCLLAGILITVWPFSPNGNFFNNWLAIIYSLPFGFYLHSIYVRNEKDLDEK